MNSELLYIATLYSKCTRALTLTNAAAHGSSGAADGDMDAGEEWAAAQVRNWPSTLSGAAAGPPARQHAPCDIRSTSTARRLRGAGFARSLTPLCPRPCQRRAAGPARGGLHRPGRHRDFARNCIQTGPGVQCDWARRFGSGQAARAV